MVSAREVRELLDERPDLETAIEAVLDAEPPWDFHDIDIDSGRFGELVANGVVEKTEDGYRIPDRDAVRRALASDLGSPPDQTEWTLPAVSFPVDQLEAVLLVGALALVVGFRLVPWPTVFREGHVVLSGNDPYFYRYLVERLLENPDVTPSNLGSGVARGEPLLVVSLWLVARLFGGTPDAAGHVLAWYPVATAVLTAAFIYATTTLVTDDRRIGLAAVAMLAVIPGHAFRTSLGFADHHPFDYLWLAVTLFGIVLVAHSAARDESRVAPKTLAGVVTIAVGVAAQTLAWDNSALIVAALAPYLALEALRAVNADDSPLRTLGPVLVGLALATALAWTVHDRLGWHTELVVAAPLLVLIGGVGILVAAELFYRLSFPGPALAVAEAVIALVVAYSLKSLRPEDWSRLTTAVDTRLLAPRPIAEVQSIFSDSLGWLLLFGFVLVLALPYLLWATNRAATDARWVPPVAYAWYFLVLSGIQARFVGELSPVIAIFAGLGLVHLAERADLARRPLPFTEAHSIDLRLPDSRQATQLAMLFFLVASLSFIQVPVKTSQITTPPELSDTAFYLAEHSDEHSFTYPENYVFSGWSRNRVYNYFVSGESRSYGYARSNFDDFLASTDPGAWYERLSPRRFVVVSSDAAATEEQLGALLYTNNGSRTETQPGLAHYRMLYVSASGRYKAFELVPGAVLRGQVEPNETVVASTTVDLPGATINYTRVATADTSGNYSLRLAHPGTYFVDEGSVTVSERAVLNGTVIRVFE